MRISVGGKEYKINKVDTRVLDFTTGDWTARLLGLSLETYREINAAIANGAEVKVLRR